MFNITSTHRKRSTFYFLLSHIVLLSLISCGTSPFFVGTYTGKGSQGIYKYVLRNNGKIEMAGLAAISENPSFLAKSKDMIAPCKSVRWGFIRRTNIKVMKHLLVSLQVTNPVRQGLATHRNRVLCSQQRCWHKA